MCFPATIVLFKINGCASGANAELMTAHLIQYEAVYHCAGCGKAAETHRPPAMEMNLLKKYKNPQYWCVDLWMQKYCAIAVICKLLITVLLQIYDDIPNVPQPIFYFDVHFYCPQISLNIFSGRQHQIIIHNIRVESI